MRAGVRVWLGEQAAQQDQLVPERLERLRYPLWSLSGCAHPS